MAKENENINLLIDHLFRHESGKMVSVLTKILGAGHIDLAEDVVQDAIIEAINQWTYKGVPENPTGWLYKVAQYKALNFIKRQKVHQKYSSEVIHFLQSEWTADPAINHFFSEQEIEDDQLRMMFTCCHPSISSDSQIALTLKTLCGFSIPEIAKAFLTNEENINKRLVRARRIIRENKIAFEVPRGIELEKRLEIILETIYLLFNEGYSSSGNNEIIRRELCEEAIRLLEIVTSNAQILKKDNANALLSLMILNAARFTSRQNADGASIELARQNRKLWDKKYMAKGIELLEKSVTENQVSKYHILAAISAHHCTAKDDKTTDWQSILNLYDNLLMIDNSPIVLLNRAVAISKVFDVQKAIAELEKISLAPALQSYHYYFSTLGEFYLKAKRERKAEENFLKAIRLTKNQAEKDILLKKLSSC